MPRDGLRLHAAGALALLAYGGLAVLARRQAVDVGVFWGAAALVWLAMLAAVRGRAAPGLRAVLAWSALFHLIGVLGGPFLEDDVHRYLWDGYRFALDGTPYGLAPAHWFDDVRVAAALRPHLEQLNYPDLPTIYAPLTQWLFRAGYHLAPGAVWPLAAMQALASLGVIALLAPRVPARALLLYAWNPLVVVELGFMAHPEAPAMLGALAAVLLLSGGRTWAGGALLGAACASRVAFVALLPLALVARARPGAGPFAAGSRALAAAGAVIALAWLPFLLRGGTEGDVLARFATEWQFNAGAFLLLEALTGQARLLLALLLFAATAALMLRIHARGPQALPLAAAILLALPPLLGPVCNAWYLLWALPFAVLAGLRVAPALVSAAVLLSYGTAHNLGLAPIEMFELPLPVLVAEHGLIAIAVAREWRRRVQRVGAAGGGSSVNSVSSR